MKTSKIRFFSPARLILAGSLFVFGLGTFASVSTPALAQGAKKGAGKGRKGLSKKALTAVSEKTGKPVTPALRKQLMDMAKTRDDAIEAANTKFYADFAAATGLTVDQVKEITTPQRGAGGGKRGGGGPEAPAPAAPGAPAAPAVQ